MKIKAFDYIPGIINNNVFFEDETYIKTEEELKQIVKKLLSGMKKRNFLSFNIISESGYYMTVNKYDSFSEAYETTYYDRNFNNNGTMLKSAKNIIAWTMEVFKADNNI